MGVYGLSIGTALNGVMAPILRYFTEFGSFQGPLRKGA